MKRPTHGTGRAQKRAALELIEAKSGPLLRAARRCLLEVLLVRGRATLDDVHPLVRLPAGVNPVCFGAVPGGLARAGIISPDGFTTSNRPEAHARPVALWRLVDPAAARSWLTSHPAIPFPAGAQQGLLF